jgi:hypothetical protein
MDAIPNINDTLAVLLDPPPPLEREYNSMELWHIYNKTIEPDIAAVHVMTGSFHDGANCCFWGDWEYHRTRIKFTTSSGKLVKILIGFHTKPFDVCIKVDECKTFLKSSDAGYIKKSIEKAISGNKRTNGTATDD